MVGVSGEVGKGRGVWDVISFWTGREQEDGSSFLRRMSGVGMEEGAGGGGFSGKGNKHQREAETCLEIRVPSCPLGGFSRFKLERGKISGWKGQEVAVGSGWLSLFFPCLSLSTHTPRIQRGLVFFKLLSSSDQDNLDKRRRVARNEGWKWCGGLPKQHFARPGKSRRYYRPHHQHPPLSQRN